MPSNNERSSESLTPMTVVFARLSNTALRPNRTGNPFERSSPGHIPTVSTALPVLS